jgi:hypothetical protein
MADTLRNSPTEMAGTSKEPQTSAQTAPGWVRAAGASVLTLIVLVVAFFYVPQWILTKLASPPRGVRVWMATAWMGFAFGLACYSAWRSTAPRFNRR